YAELTRVHFGDARENVAKLFRGSVRLSLIAGAVIVALLLLAGKPVLALVAGPAYVAAYPLLLLLGIAAAIELGGVSFEPALVATGRAGLALKLRFVSSGLFLALLAVLLPAVGATGAALASLAAALTSLLLFGAAAWRAVHR
ncbi:MAG TPA: lipopolysaccharide biosynthesis protein, partial [Allosphingosinicella sp.]